jgi:lipopolysaccharide export system protein LptA
MNNPARWDKAKIKRRIILLLVALLLGVVWYCLNRVYHLELQIPPVKLNRKVPDYEFQVVSISQVSGTQTFYRVSANSLALDREQALLEQASGVILNDNQPVWTFTAPSGLLDIPRQLFTFNALAGETSARYGRPWKITAPLAFWDNNTQKFIFERRPRLTDGEIRVSADRMVYDLASELLIIDTECEIARDGYQVRGDKAVLQNATDVLTLENNVVFSGQDFQARADLLDWAARAEDLIFKNNVQLQTETMSLTADTASLNSTQDLVFLQGDVRMQSRNATQDIVVNTDRALWVRGAQKIEFYENTRVRGNASLIQSEQLVYDLAKNELIASGDSRTKIIKANE